MKALLRNSLFLLIIAGSLTAPAPVLGVVRSDDLVGGIAAADRDEGESPDVEMGAGALATPDGRLLWARDPAEVRAMASTTKIMTAVVVLENADLDEPVSIAAVQSRAGESVADLRPGEVYTVRELLEALIVPSGNDAAAALAVHVGGTPSRFVEMMNAKAQDLGMGDTHYMNPHGLDESGHVTTAEDLAVLSTYAMRNPEFRRVASLRQASIDGGNGERLLESRNLLLGDVVGANGIKTGWTSQAGFCFVGSATRNDVEFVAVVMGAWTDSARFDQAETLLEWGFDHYNHRSFASVGETMGAVTVSDYLDREVHAVIEDGASGPVFDLDGEIVEKLTLLEEIEAPVEVGQRLGTLTITQGERLLAQSAVVAAEEVPEPGFFERVWISIVRGWRGLMGGGEPALS